MKKKVLIVLGIIILVLIIGITLLVVFNNKSKEITINDVNNVSTTKKLDINIYDLKKTSIGYEMKVSIKNNSKEDMSINSMKLSLKNNKDKLIYETYVNIDDVIKVNDTYIAELGAENDLSDVSIIDYELID